MTAKEMWNVFCDNHNLQDTPYEAWCFGDDPDGLAELVLTGKKTGTASAYPLYELDQEPLPKEGEYSVILNSREEAVCVIRTTRVYVQPYCEVGEDHARKEGEGDCSLAYWRQVHEAFFTKEMKEAGLSFYEEMPLVLEEFEVVYKAHA